MNTITILTWLQAPVLALVMFIYMKAKFDLKTWKYILRALGLGLLSAVFIILFDLIAGHLGYDQLKNLKRSAFFSFVIIGFGSELGKFLVLRYVFLPLKHFRSPFDSIVYSTIITLGFVTITLPLYEFGFFSHNVETVFLVTYPLANVMFAIIMGFFLGMGKMRKNRLIDSFTGLGSAAFFHGFFFFSFLTSDKTILLIYGIGLFFIGALLAVKAMNLRYSDEAKGL
jgi:RsiW-degrading membrane proteinase PrsW (M82 family)